MQLASVSKLLTCSVDAVEHSRTLMELVAVLDISSRWITD